MQYNVNGKLVEVIKHYNHIYCNTTPHPITFMHPETKEEFTIEPSGFILNAKVQEKDVSNYEVEPDLTFVRTEFIPDKEGQNFIDILFLKIPDILIIGSIIAAQAYPGQVMAMTPCPGYERVAPNEKRMNPFKFTVF